MSDFNSELKTAKTGEVKETQKQVNSIKEKVLWKVKSCLYSIFTSVYLFFLSFHILYNPELNEITLS